MSLYKSRQRDLYTSAGCTFACSGCNGLHILRALYTELQLLALAQPPTPALIETNADLTTLPFVNWSPLTRKVIYHTRTPSPWNASHFLLTFCSVILGLSWHILGMSRTNQSNRYTQYSRSVPDMSHKYFNARGIFPLHFGPKQDKLEFHGTASGADRVEKV